MIKKITYSVLTHNKTRFHYLIKHFITNNIITMTIIHTLNIKYKIIIYKYVQRSYDITFTLYTKLNHNKNYFKYKK